MSRSRPLKLVVRWKRMTPVRWLNRTTGRLIRWADSRNAWEPSIAIGRLAQAEAGATAVEFALVLPMFLTLVFGTVEFGLLLWTQQALQETAIAGARCVAIAQGSNPTTSPCASGGTTSYIDNVANGWGLTLASVTANTPTSGACKGLSQVTLTSTFTSVAPSLVNLATGGITLTASACYPNNP